MTPHFNASELIRTQQPFDNTPTDKEWGLLKQFAMNMEHVRSILGDKPIAMTSVFRSDKVNEAVGGSRTSHHRMCLAGDFVPPKQFTVYQAVEKINKSWLHFDQLINEQDRGVVHISFAPSFRRQLLTAVGRKEYISGNLPA